MRPKQVYAPRQSSWFSISTAMKGRSIFCCRWPVSRRSISQRFRSWRWPTSILPLSQRQRRLRLEIAADYLVMAAWLAYLKSRLLVAAAAARMTSPRPRRSRPRSGIGCNCWRRCRPPAARLMARPRLGHDFFLRGAPEGLATVPVPVWQLELYELLRAYGDEPPAHHSGGADDRALRLPFDGRRLEAPCAVSRPGAGLARADEVSARGACAAS